jgi:DNA-directed RNA polymerase specialized sigma24 family protein
MSSQNTFENFIRRIRAGDEQAALELVRSFEPLIRRQIRLQLEAKRLGRLFDSMDVCQSVLKSFFFRTAAGEYDLETPEQLQRLLVTMTRNKLASAARYQSRQRRDTRRVAEGEGQLEGVAGRTPSPSEEVSGRELLEHFRRGLNDSERQVAELRSQGRTWADIAAVLGGTAQARRMELARAVARVARELGLDDADFSPAPADSPNRDPL